MHSLRVLLPPPIAQATMPIGVDSVLSTVGGGRRCDVFYATYSIALDLAKILLGDQRWSSLPRQLPDYPIKRVVPGLPVIRQESGSLELFGAPEAFAE